MSEPQLKLTKTHPSPQVQAVLEGPDEWQRVIAPWQSTLEASARETKALQRKRKIQAASDLLRLVLAYSQCDWSLQQVGAWATAMQVSAASMSTTALHNRLRQCQPWLSRLVGQLLQAVPAAAPPTGVRVRLMDATVICQPGSRGTDWRIHLSWNAGTLSLDGIELTDGRGGESLTRHLPQADDIGIADRGYAHRRGLGEWLARAAQLVVRINAQNLPLETAPNQPLDLGRWLQALPASTACRAQRVWVSTPSGRFALRVIAQRLPPAAAQAALRRLLRTSRKKGRVPSALSKLMTGWVVLVTNLPPARWSAAAVLGLYRLRWQVELVIKRAKSVLQVDQLRAKDPAMVQVYLLAKLMGLLLLDRWTRQQLAQLADWFDDPHRPVSLWRWTALWADQLRAVVRGAFTWQVFLTALPQLKRYVCDRPRHRPQQLAHARRLLCALGLTPADGSIPQALAGIAALS